MPRYRIEVRPRFERDLAALTPPVRKRIAAKVEGLADNPRPAGCKKLKGSQNTWRLRVGDHRVLYDIHDDVLLLVLVRVGDRKDVYDG